MKLRIEPSICVILCILPSICSGQAQMTIDECVNTAIAYNRSIQLSQQDANIAVGRIKEVKGAGNTHLNVFGQGKDRSDVINLPLAVGIDNGNLILSSFPYIPKAAASYGVSVSQVLDFNGMIRTGTNVAKIDAQTAGLNISGTRNDVVLQTKLAYYDVLRSEELLDVAKEAMKNAETRKHTAQALVDTGIASKVDIIRADASISAAQQSIITAQNAIQVTKSVVNRIIGVDVNTPFEVDKPNEDALNLAPYETYLNEALAKRPEAAIASKNISASKLRYKLAKNGMSPSFVFSAGGQVDAIHDIEQENFAYVGLSATFPLSDGGETSGRKEQAKAGIESAKIAEADTKAAITLQVKTAYVRVQNAAEKLATANKELEQAAESLRLSRARYSEGMSSQVELSDAELTFTQAQTNVVNARYEQLGSQAELERAIGKYAK
ncbi:TolC family protein [bacterium]|nr:TolC family protein [bacterium]